MEKYFIGIDLGGTIVKVGAVAQGRVLGVRRIEAQSGCGLSPRLDAIAAAVDDLIAEAGSSAAEPGGVAMAFPGVVDVRRRRAALTNAKYDDAPQLDLVCWCRAHWGVPFAIDNDARMATVGEWRYGAARGKRNVVMMTIGTGIGTGAIVDGRLLYGRRFCAGALGGHLIVDWQGRSCTCGNTGCVEAEASSFFLPQIVGDDRLLGETFRSDPAQRDFKTLFAGMAAGNADARRVVERCMNVWSAAVVNYIHAYDPETVVLGGGVMKSREVILPYIRRRVEALAWTPGEKPDIVVSELGDDAALVAAEYYFGEGRPMLREIEFNG